MADVGDDLLDGDLDETAFGDLDGEEEDALLADDDYESYQNSRQGVFSDSSQGGQGSDMFHIHEQVQDVSEGDEIIEDGEEDVLELGVVDELDESELDNGQGNNIQQWSDSSSRTIEADNSRGEVAVGVSSSTTSIGAIGGESDEEETDGRGSRFKTERTNIISLKGVTSGKSLSEIPDSLDKVKTNMNKTILRPRGGMQRIGRGNIRGRLGPIQRGGMPMRGGFGAMRYPNMMPPPRQPPPGHKIHINPHFRGGMHQGHVWDNERLPPPPGCESFMPPMNPHNDGNWGGPMPHHMGRPPFPQQHPGPPHMFQNPQMYPPPQQQQGYEEQYRPVMDPPQQNPPNRIVQFSENTQLITVENQHFQRQSYDQNFGPPNNQFQPPQNNQFQPPQNQPPNFNNVFPNQFNNSPPRPNFQPQQFPTSNQPQNFMGYSQNEYQSSPNPPPFQNYDNSSWNPPSYPVDNQQNQFGPPSQPQPPPFCNVQQSTQPQFRPAQPPPQNQQSNFVSPQQKEFQGGTRGPAIKRLAPRQLSNSPAVPAKQARFEYKQKTIPVITRTNLQEIKTVDNLPDTTTAQEPEPEIEEDEETKQYRLKIAEQKALREKILKEKEARRLAAIREKQKQNENITRIVPTPMAVPQPQLQPQSKPQLQSQPKPITALQGRGRTRNHSANRIIPKQPRKEAQTPAPDTPVVKIQQMLGTVYKIVKVRTKEGAIVTRKTPLVRESANEPPTPMRTVSSMTPPQRRVVLNTPNQVPVRMVSNVGRGGGGFGPRGNVNSTRMVSLRQTQGRTLFTVNTSSQPRMQAPQRLVIDNKRPLNPLMKLAATPNIPVSSLVTVNNLSLSTTQNQIQKLAKEAGLVTLFKHEPEFRRATIKFQNPKEAEQFYHKFHRKMIDLSRISVTVVPE